MGYVLYEELKDGRRQIYRQGSSFAICFGHLGWLYNDCTSVDIKLIEYDQDKSRWMYRVKYRTTPTYRVEKDILVIEVEDKNASA